MDKVYVLTVVEAIQPIDWDEEYTEEIYSVHKSKEDAQKEATKILDIVEEFLDGHPYYSKITFIRHEDCVWAEDNTLMYQTKIYERPLK